VAKFLAAWGFSVCSLSDVVREAAAGAGLALSRDNLIATGVRLRTEEGPGVLAARILPRLEGRFVVDSIRGPAEVAVLRTLPPFVLIGVDAPRPIRFERSRLRGRLGDGATLAEFERQEEQENARAETGQQLRRTLALADRVLTNDGTIADLHARALALFEELGMELPPPAQGAR
jgi:dephospho-CoA kinase